MKDTVGAFPTLKNAKTGRHVSSKSNVDSRKNSTTTFSIENNDTLMLTSWGGGCITVSSTVGVIAELLEYVDSFSFMNKYKTP